MKFKRIPLKSSAGNYSIVAGTGVLRHAARELARLGRFSNVRVVSSPRVWRAIRNSVRRGLRLSGSNAVHLMNDAESAKNLQTVESLSRSLVKSGTERTSLIVAVGGGVVCAVAGFVSASLLRCVALVHVPTAVVAQVDSSFGS